MKERLKLVESFSELRAGMIVVVEFCPLHTDKRGMHRGILTGQTMSVTCGTMCWTLVPSPHVGYPHALVGPTSVTKSRVWRVDDGLEAFDTQTSKRSTKKRLEKSR